VIAKYHVLRERIAHEFEDIRRAADKAQHAFHLAGRGGADESVYLDSAALNLHGFYIGIERMFESLAKEIDDVVPSSGAWHHELLSQMELEIPKVRPAVIRSSTRAALEDYLKFRHLVRNVYTWEFSGGRIKDLIDRLPQTLRDLESDLEGFRGFLDAAGHADET
jgi:hypothetical protein